MHIRFRFSLEDKHTHVRVFIAPEAQFTHAKCGDLVFDNIDWEIFRKMLPTSASVEYCLEGPRDRGI